MARASPSERTHQGDEHEGQGPEGGEQHDDEYCFANRFARIVVERNRARVEVLRGRPHLRWPPARWCLIELGAGFFHPLVLAAILAPSEPILGSDIEWRPAILAFDNHRDFADRPRGSGVPAAVKRSAMLSCFNALQAQRPNLSEQCSPSLLQELGAKHVSA